MWKSIEIQGKRIDLFEPPGKPPVGGLLFLHDRDGITWPDLGEANRFLESERLAVACPLGGECWWTDRIWPGFDPSRSAERWLTEGLLPDLRRRWSNAPVALTGIGMGGQGALRIAFKHPELVAVVGTVDAAVDCHNLYYEGTPLDDLYPSREHCRQDSPVLQVDPAKQPRHIFFACDPNSCWESGNDRLHEKLTAIGVPHRFSLEPRDVAIKALLAFVKNALVEESRRLF